MFTSLAIAGLAGHVGGPGFGFGWLLLLIPLFWVLVVALVFGVFGRRFRRARWGGYGPGYGHWSAAGRGAETTLAERFAKGDIEEQEYRARLEVLRANAYPAQPDKS